MKTMKKLLSGALVSAMMLSLAACGGSSAPTDTSKTPAPDASSQQTAKASGSLTVYTGCGPEITDPIIRAFNEKYPDVKVEIVKAGSGELLARIKAETGNAGGDLLIGGEPYLYESNKDLFEPYVSETDKDMIISSPDGLWHPWSIMLTPIMVNKSRMPDQNAWPKTLKELADAKYAKDKIAFCNPEKSGTGATITNNITSLYDWDTFSAMLANCDVLDGSDPMFNGVKDGTYPIGFVNEDLGLKWKSVGMPIDLIYPTDGVINTVDCLSIIKGAKNLDNAKLFIDFFGSADNHKIIVNDIARRSTRKDATLAEGMTPTSEFKLIEAKKISRDEISAKYNEAYEASRKK